AASSTGSHPTATDTLSLHDALPISIHPPYYEKDELTDKSMRFFVSEMIREKIFKLYDKEIPYSTEIVVTSYKEEDTITRIADTKDRKSTRLNSSHVKISYAVFCLKQ